MKKKSAASAFATLAATVLGVGLFTSFVAGPAYADPPLRPDPSIRYGNPQYPTTVDQVGPGKITRNGTKVIFTYRFTCPRANVVSLSGSLGQLSNSPRIDVLGGSGYDAVTQTSTGSHPGGYALVTCTGKKQKAELPIYLQHSANVRGLGGEYGAGSDTFLKGFAWLSGFSFGFNAGQSPTPVITDPSIYLPGSYFHYPTKLVGSQQKR